MFNFNERVIPLDVWITNFVDWLFEGYRWFYQIIKWPGFKLAGFTLGSLVLVGLLGFCPETMITLAVVFSSVVFCTVVWGVPFGIWAGRSDRFNDILGPVLDAMQTIPAFV